MLLLIKNGVNKMTSLKRIAVILCVLCVFTTLRSQTVSPQVINMTGSDYQLGNSDFWITDNVGEPFTETLANPTASLMISQGFLQPGKLSPGGIQPVLLINQPHCLDHFDDGYISVAFNSTVKQYSVQNYIWSPASICPGNNCATVDSLLPGSYSLSVVVNYTDNFGVSKVDTIKQGPIRIVPGSELCRIKIYSGITPNADANNDFLTIDHIQEYPNNTVEIFNRWGKKVASISGYDNSSKVWPTRAELDFLISSTYFYVIDLKDGGSLIKGWVELIKSE